MEVLTLSLGPLGTNCYIIINAKEALIIDPGGEANKIIEKLKEKNTTPKAILLTHAHFDHIGAVEDLRNHYDIGVYLHENESEWLLDSRLNGSFKFVGNEIKTKKPEHTLSEGSLTISSFTFDIKHTPGHSPGSVIFVFEKEQWIFGGDVLFYGGVGRTDLRGGDMSQLIQSIQNKFYSLPDDFIVYPGHGPKTSILFEKNNNPFVSYRL
ncbi:MBL fold metallo-hydrolase [Oceanobacillus sp. Castelsardo]|uniref:MBL fold metallo-hydrolase n=1 Tax=Oceanobacillus sp. Castelsardo TaxID=1851204 RepID=UPI0008395032|nr:MBL fold metallo-hydrolase [Oceanobacillus sp. Castelsardo]